MLVFEMTQSPLQLPNLRWKHQTSRLTDASLETMREEEEEIMFIVLLVYQSPLKGVGAVFDSRTVWNRFAPSG